MPAKPLKRHTPLQRRKPLRNKTPLKSKKGINRMSDKAKAELKIWLKVVAERRGKLLEKFGYIPCELCQQRIIDGSELHRAEGHHNNHNRRDCSPVNCRVVHRCCNQLIEEQNIKDVPSLL